MKRNINNEKKHWSLPMKKFTNFIIHHDGQKLKTFQPLHVSATISWPSVAFHRGTNPCQQNEQLCGTAQWCQQDCCALLTQQLSQLLLDETNCWYYIMSFHLHNAYVQHLQILSIYKSNNLWFPWRLPHDHIAICKYKWNNCNCNVEKEMCQAL